MKKSETHLKTEDRIDQYVSGKLSQDQTDEVWMEILASPQHYDYLKTAVALRTIAAESTITAIPPTHNVPIRHSTGLRKYAVAAGIALAVGATSVYIYSQDGQTVVRPLEALEFTTLRSTATLSASELQQSIQQAINLSLQGDASGAIVLLTQIYEEQVSSDIRAEALINIGIIQYNSDDFSGATRSFSELLTRFTDDPMLVERAQWNLAQAYMALGESDKARESLEMVVAMDGAHSRIARNYLTYLR